MKSTALIASVAILAAAFSVAANATGRPSTVEVQSAADTPHVVVADQELGSYARYLMLNGATRDEAVVEARNVDHPAARKLVASRSRAHADATTRQ